MQFHMNIIQIVGTVHMRLMVTSYFINTYTSLKWITLFNNENCVLSHLSSGLVIQIWYLEKICNCKTDTWSDCGCMQCWTIVEGDLVGRDNNIVRPKHVVLQWRTNLIRFVGIILLFKLLRESNKFDINVNFICVNVYDNYYTSWL